jgi:hypothetical protein
VAKLSEFGNNVAATKFEIRTPIGNTRSGGAKFEAQSTKTPNAGYEQLASFGRESACAQRAVSEYF